jgi:eukaryotic-like serine/threonine-protein kinase
MIGTLLGNRYEILEKIGEGGMAEVYKAKCHLLNRFVAVKILKDEYSSDKEFVDKFKAEAAAAGSISNSNIVNIYDVGSQENVNYIVMEYVHGRTLKEVIIQSGRLDYNRALDIAIQIGKALECAHKNGIIHRDIKPQNILVTDEGLVKVTDFGIAKAANSATITNSNKVMGSAHYFSPEQAKGTFVDARTDIYSLGIVLYEMVTGRVPYDAESPVSVALKHLQEQVLPPKNININLPEGLNNLILKAMQKDAISRYQNIKDMLLDLQRIKNSSEYKIEIGNAKDEYTKIMSPIIDTSEDLEEETTNKSGKKMLLILIPLALLVIFAGFFSGWYFKSRKTNPNNQAVTSKEVKVPGIIGLSEQDAKAAVEAKNLKFYVVSKEKSDKPEGTVISSSPEEGTPAKVNSEVRVYISSGTQSVEVPNVKEIDLVSASKMIENNGFQVGIKTFENSETVPKDNIIRQSPEAGSQAAKNSKVDLVISKGVETKYTTVPDLSGRSITEAESLLGSVNLKIGIKTTLETTDEKQINKIINQKPNANTQNVKEGSTVDITIGVEKKIKVPNLIGLTVGKAKIEADKLGLSLNVSAKDTDIVETQNPIKDTSVSKGAVINLTAKPAVEGGTTTPTTTGENNQVKP